MLPKQDVKISCMTSVKFFSSSCEANSRRMYMAAFKQAYQCMSTSIHTSNSMARGSSTQYTDHKQVLCHMLQWIILYIFHLCYTVPLPKDEALIHIHAHKQLCFTDQLQGLTTVTDISQSRFELAYVSRGDCLLLWQLNSVRLCG